MLQQLAAYFIREGAPRRAASAHVVSRPAAQPRIEPLPAEARVPQRLVDDAVATPVRGSQMVERYRVRDVTYIVMDFRAY